MKYEKIPLKGYNVLNMYPVYIEGLLSREPFKIVGLRENEIELRGDWSGMNNTIANQWFPISECFVIKKSCIEELGPEGCQIPNIHCCGGGSVIAEHTEYWK